MIELAGIERVFTLGDSRVHALHALDLAVAPGEYVAIMGPRSEEHTSELQSH